MKRRVPKLIDEPTSSAQSQHPSALPLLPEGLVPPEMLKPSEKAAVLPLPALRGKKVPVTYMAPCGCSLVLLPQEDQQSLLCAHQTSVRMYRYGSAVRVDISGPGFYTSGELDGQGRFRI